MLGQVLVCALALGGMDDFRALPGGVVFVDGQFWPSLTDWHASEGFARHGGRCATKPSANAGERGDDNRGDGCGQFETDVSNDFDFGGTQAIPVVFHVITLDDEVNIEDCTGHVSPAVLQQQIDVINEDFGGASGAGAAETQFAFSLAGISYLRNDDWHSQAETFETEYRTALNVDPDHYINVYVNSCDGFLGWAYFPYGNMAGSDMDGIVIAYGSVPGSGGSFGLGRTLSHELGHYLGLYHTFGGTSDADETTCPFGDCYTNGDLICDTHPEETPSSGCTDRGTCGDPDSIHNFLNYTRDSCMTEFTDEQAIRLRCTLMTFRSTFLNAAPEVRPCCTNDSCIIMESGDCSTAGGTWAQAGETCADVDCSSVVPTGACCVGERCSVAAEADCATAGGTWHGAGVACDSDICGGSKVLGDNCTMAITVIEGSTSFDITGLGDSGQGAVDETQCPDTFGQLTAPDIWFVYTPAASGTAVFDTCDTNSYDTSMAIYTGTCGVLTQVACNGDTEAPGTCQEFWSHISMVVEAGTSYFVRIGGFGIEIDQTGSLNLALETVCPGDGDGDNSIGPLDLTGLMITFGGADATYDLNGNGTVDVRDLIQMLRTWGPC